MEYMNECMSVSCGEGAGAVGRGVPESPLPNTSTDQRGLGQGGRQGSRGRLPPCLPAGGPGHRAGRVHIHSCPGDPGCLPRLPRPALTACGAPAVKQRLATHVLGQSGEPSGCGDGGIPSWPLRCEIKYQTLTQPNLCRLCVGGGGAGGAWQAVPRVLPCTSEPEKGKAEGLKVCQLQNVLFTAEVVSGELELGARSLLLHVGCVTSARDFSLSLTFSPLQNGSKFFPIWELW